MSTIEQAREVSSRIWLAGYVDESATIDALIAELEQYKVDFDEQMLDNAELKEELNALKSQDPETYYRHFDGGTQDYSSESTVPLYLAAGAQDQRKVLEQALEVLQDYQEHIYRQKTKQAITAIQGVLK